jgi:hypothetical protein
MNDSILNSIKKLLGITEECEDFDVDLIIHINSVFMILNQIGVGPSEGFVIEDMTATWNDFTKQNNLYVMVKSYMFMKVKLMFDPPLGSVVMECFKLQISELEWRLNLFAESDTDDDGSHENYTGTYVVTPKAFDDQTLDTSGKIMTDDLTINKVPFYETSNTAGGKTSYIAKED